MPGGDDVEGAADLDAPGAMGKIDRQQRNVRDALVPFVLEMVLGQPQRLVSQRVGRAGQRRRGLEHLRQPRVGVAPIVRRRAVQPASLELDVPDVQRREPRDHDTSPGRA
jgi:hypothetical protein